MPWWQPTKEHNMMSQRDGKYLISAVKCRSLESAQFTLPACLNKDRRPARLYSLWCCQRETFSRTLLTTNKISLSEIKESALSVRDTALHMDKLPPQIQLGDWWGPDGTEGNWKSGLFELSCGHEVLFTVMNKPHSQIINELFPRRG